MLCWWSWSDTAGQPEQILCVWHPGIKVGVSLGLLSPEAWLSSCAWDGQQSQLLIRAKPRSNLDSYFQHCKPASQLKRQTKILANPFTFSPEPNLFSGTCTSSCSGVTEYFFVSLLCFPWPFIAQVWQQRFRCTKGIESTFLSQSGGVWVSNVPPTDFLGSKKHFSLT